MSLQLQSKFSAQTLALDPQGTESLRRTASRDSQAGARAVAQQFEALLLQQMLGSMRKANQSLGEEGSGAFGLFRSMQDQQFAQTIAMKSGAGLADAIVRQINVQRGSESQKQPLVSQRVTDDKAASGTATTAAPAAKAAASGGVEGFLSKLSGVAEDAADALGLSPKLVLAHAALESGWGRKEIKAADGSTSHNLFGIKAGKSWTGKTVDVLTTEYVDGRAQKRVEKFRAYDSYTEAFGDYASLIKRRFGDALGQGADGASFGRALQSGGYATDPQYANKLAQVAKSIAARQSGSSLAA